MKQVTFFEYPIIWSTYSSEDYDRSNDDLPCLLLKLNAKDFGGYYRKELESIYNELNIYKNTEMKEAFQTSQLYKTNFNKKNELYLKLNNFYY